MKRKLAAAISIFGAVLTLWAASAHWHELTTPRAPDAPGCVYCVGGMIAVPTVTEAPIVALCVEELERVFAVQDVPAMRYPRLLDHSGNAPPL